MHREEDCDNGLPCYNKKELVKHLKMVKKITSRVNNIEHLKKARYKTYSRI